MPPPIDYVEAARRHTKDGHILLHSGQRANAGQLFGISVECGLKALLVACGVPTDASGGIPLGHRLRQHMPVVWDRTVLFGHLVPNQARLSHYMALVPDIGLLTDWAVEHRYFREASIPLGSLSNWELASIEVLAMLDQANLDGVL